MNSYDVTLVAEILQTLATEGRTAAAAAAEAAASARPDDHLAVALDHHLQREARTGVYDQAAGFSSFIDNGSNPRLYRATIDRLREVHRSRNVESVVDLGAGDGRVTSAVLGPSIQAVDVIEPSRDLLTQARARDWPITPNMFNGSAQEFLRALPDAAQFDLVQATFALHAIEPVDRADILAGLASHARAVAIVDFDVPDFDDRSPEHAVYAASRYHIGVQQYRSTPVAIGDFLIPVLTGQFDPDTPRVTFEQSANRWRYTLEAAGFTVQLQRLCDYWWAPAFAITAIPQRLSTQRQPTTRKVRR